MANNILTQEFIQNAIAAENVGNLFPIDFSDVWRGAGYARRDSALRRVKEDLVEGDDYLHIPVEPDNHAGLSPQEKGALASAKEIRLSVDGLDHLMMMAQTPQGRAARKMFIQYKRAYIRSLESLLPVDRPAQLEETIEQILDSIEEFPVSLDLLHQATRIVSKSYIKKAIERDLVLGQDYTDIEGRIFLTIDMFHIMCLVFRSAEGTDVAQLPQIIKIATVEYFRIQEARRANSRMGKRWDNPDQIAIDFV